MTDPAHPRLNRLLAAMPEAELQCRLPSLERVDLASGQVLYEPGVTPNHVLFPTSAIVSLMHLTESGASAEIAAVGSEGLVGIPLFLGGGSTTSRGVVQSTGVGFRIGAPAIRDVFDRSPPVRLLLLRYMQALMTQMAQTAVCNRHHSLEQRLCRLLLQRLERQQGYQLVITQEAIGQMLGVRREGVNEAALGLQAAGMIRCVRGHIEVLDRPRLERRSCECYEVVRREYERLVPRVPAIRCPAPVAPPSIRGIATCRSNRQRHESAPAL